MRNTNKMNKFKQSCFGGESLYFEVCFYWLYSGHCMYRYRRHAVLFCTSVSWCLQRGAADFIEPTFLSGANPPAVLGRVSVAALVHAADTAVLDGVSDGVSDGWRGRTCGADPRLSGFGLVIGGVLRAFSRRSGARSPGTRYAGDAEAKVKARRGPDHPPPPPGRKEKKIKEKTQSDRIDDLMT